jgi:MoaA/NifB/PqqE/SkfB family radical SAM enzyme
MKTNVSAYLNFLRSHYERRTGEMLLRSYPYFLGIDPCSFCQLRCPLCPTGVENESKKSQEKVSFRNRTMLSVELLDNLLAEVGEYLFFIMFFNWGEPLLNKNLPSFIRKARALDIYTEIHTNLSLRVSDRSMEELLRSGVNDIAASIDGFSQDSYQIYRVGGNYALAKDNIKRLAQTRTKLNLDTNIIWNFLVFSFNEHEIEATKQYCDENGIIFNRREAFIKNPDWLPSYRKQERTTLKISMPKATTDSVVDERSTQQPDRITSCAWHYNYSFVNSDGSVSPCCAPWEQTHDFGVLKPGLVSFADVWNNNMYRKSRAAFAHKEIKGLDLVNTICLTCPFDESIQNQYSNLDEEVINQFKRVYKDSEQLLRRAFSLLADEDDFVSFFKKNFIDDESPAATVYSLK